MASVSGERRIWQFARRAALLTTAATARRNRVVLIDKSPATVRREVRRGDEVNTMDDVLGV